MKALSGQTGSELWQSETLRKHNISQGTFYRWKRAYGGMEVNELKRLKELEQENASLKRLVADQERSGMLSVGRFDSSRPAMFSRHTTSIG